MTFEPQVVFVTVNIDDEVNIYVDDDEEFLVEADVTITHNDFPHYTGDYIVTPKVRAQILETVDKIMDDDVTVEEIPYHAVSNQFNGLTVTIGG